MHEPRLVVLRMGKLYGREDERVPAHVCFGSLSRLRVLARTTNIRLDAHELLRTVLGFGQVVSSLINAWS